MIRIGLVALLLCLGELAFAEDPVRLELAGASDRIAEGELFVLRAVAIYADGRSVDVGGQGRWSVDDTDVLDGDQHGFLTTQPGTARIRFQFAGKEALRVITVVPKGTPPAAQLIIECELVEAEVGAAFRCHGVYSVPGKPPRRITAAGRWSCTPARVLGAGAGGEFLALAPGTAEIVLEFGGLAARRALVVKAPPAPQPPPDPPAPVPQPPPQPPPVLPPPVDPTPPTPQPMPPDQPPAPPSVPPSEPVPLPPVDSPSRPIETVDPAAPFALDREQVVLEVGEELALAPADRGAVGSWHSEAPLVLEPLGDGRYRALQPGRCEVWAARGAATARCEAVVRAPVLPESRAGAELDGRAAWVAPGETAAFALRVGGADQTGLGLWTSSRPEVLRPRGGGRFHAVSPGVAVVQGRFGEAVAAGLVVVLPADRIEAWRKGPLAIVLAQDLLHGGESGIAGLDRDGVALGELARWAVEPPDVIELNGSRLLARREGLARLSAQLDGQRIERTVAVLAGEGRLRLAVNPPHIALRRGQALRFRAELVGPGGERFEVTSRVSVRADGVALEIPVPGGLQAVGPGEGVLVVELEGLRHDVPVRVN